MGFVLLANLANYFRIPKFFEDGVSFPDYGVEVRGWADVSGLFEVWHGEVSPALEQVVVPEVEEGVDVAGVLPETLSPGLDGLCGVAHQDVALCECV